MMKTNPVRSRHAALTVSTAVTLLPILLISLAGCATGFSRIPPATAVPTSLLPEPVPIRIYSPPAWDGITPLPVIILLHGHYQDSYIFEKHGVPTALSAMMETGAIPPALLVAPEIRHGYWWNYYNRTVMAADFIVKDLIPWLDGRYPIDRQSRHIFGIGTGAMGAVEMAALFPGVFSTVGALNGLYFDALDAAAYVEEHMGSDFEKIFGPATNAKAMKSHSVYDLIPTRSAVPGTRFILGCSSMSSFEMIESNEVFRQHLFRQGIPHDVIEFFGMHRTEDSLAVIPVVIMLQLGSRETVGEWNGNPYHVYSSR